jgi:quercetin dioxygenase-like cupin family protein
MSEATHHRWDEIPREQVSPLLARKLLTGERVMLAQVYLQKGCIVPRHQHVHEQLSYVVEGALKFWVGEGEGEERIVGSQEVLQLPSNVWHAAEALADTVVLDVFSPPREDWLAGTDSYLRR